jgi:hypothetical protein
LLTIISRTFPNVLGDMYIWSQCKENIEKKKLKENTKMFPLENRIMMTYTFPYFLWLGKIWYTTRTQCSNKPLIL